MSKVTSKKPKLRYTTINGEPVLPGSSVKRKDPKEIREAIKRIRKAKLTLRGTTVEELLKEVRGGNSG